MSMEEMVDAFKQWCKKAEASGNRMLQEFAASLKQYKLTLYPN